MQKNPAMKRILLLFLSFLILMNLSAQTTFTVNKGVGNSFNPSEVIVNPGDVVHFNLTSPHDVTQVSLATWNANGTTPLAGGFVFASGSGDYTAATPGIIYYVCTQHVATDGMKGTIVVNAITGINDIQNNSGGMVFPNPATNFITYQSKGTSAINEIRIIDFTGKTVKILQKPDVSEYQIKIDIGNLDRGIYFIIVKSGDGIESGKFLKS
jgi:plastocyanin